MTVWLAFTRSPDIQALGWTLIHFLWQGTLIALVLKSALAILHPHRAQLRYWTAAVTLALLMMVPMLTFMTRRATTAPIHSRVASEPGMIVVKPASPAMSAVDGPVPAVQRTHASQPLTDFVLLRPDRWTRELQAQLPDVLAPWLAAFWIAGIVLAGVRALGGMIQANNLRKNAHEFDPDDRVRSFLMKSGAAGRVRLLQSTRVSVPTMIGWLRPTVILPDGAEVESGHLQALLAHELAHVRRRDYLVNLLQAGVEALLFFHPAVWWVSAQMRTERECCCDDLAVAACGDLRLYLRALSDAENRRSGPKLAVALRGTPLLHRIRRLTDMKTLQSSPWKKWSSSFLAFAALMIFSAASTLLAFIPVQAEPAPAQTAPRAVSDKTAVSPAPIPQPAAAAAVVQQPPSAEPRTQPAGLSTHNQPHPDSSIATGVSQPAPQEKVTGTIFDPTGSRLPGVTVSVIDMQTGKLLATAFSWADGTFEIVPPAGNYYIQFAAPGWETQVFTKSQLGSDPLMIAMGLGEKRETVTVVTAAPATAVKPASGEPARVGGNVIPPRLSRRADPVYPPEAREAGVEGAVLISALIDAEGNVKNPVVLSGPQLLRDAALTCVEQWRYQPARINNEPWPMRLSITIVFKLKR